MGFKIDEAMNSLANGIYAVAVVLTALGIIGLAILVAGMAALWTINGNMDSCCTGTGGGGGSLAPVAFQWTTSDIPVASHKKIVGLKSNLLGSNSSAGNTVRGFYQITGGFVSIQFNQVVIEGCANWTEPNGLFVAPSELPAAIRPSDVQVPGAEGNYKFSASIGPLYAFFYVVSEAATGLFVLGTCNDNMFQSFTLSTIYTTL